MSTPTTIPYDWIRQVPTILKQLDEVPLLGFPPPFPWESYSAQLSQIFQIPNLKLQSSELEWRTNEQLYAGFPNDVYHTNLILPPLEGTLDFVISKKDVEGLMRILLTKENAPSVSLDPEYLETFYNFLRLEAIYALQKTDYDKSLAPQILEEKEGMQGAALCSDITIELPNFTCVARLLLSPEFRQSLKNKYAQRTLNVPNHIAQRIEVTLHAEVGKTQLNFSDWEKIQLGDLILLDSLTLSNDEEKGRVMLTLDGKPVFRGRIKQGNIKILEYPLTYEVETPMAKYNPEDEDEHSEIEDDEDDFTDTDTDTDSDFDTDEHSDVHDTEDEDFDEETTEEDTEHALPSSKSSGAVPASKAATPPPITAKEAPTAKDIPITLTVEVGRLQITVQKLMDLQPGNLLELNVHPEDGVDLVINGKCVGKGELLKVGDVLGVRIIDLA